MAQASPSNGSTRSRESSKGRSSLHFGYVSAVDEANGTARLKLEDMDGMETYWLKILQSRVAVDKAADWLDVGDYVAAMLDEKGEQGVILGACYSAKNPPPIATKDKWYRKFGDGSVIEFDRSTGVLKVEVTRIEITCTQESTINGIPIVVVGAPDSDDETSGTDYITASNQL